MVEGMLIKKSAKLSVAKVAEQQSLHTYFKNHLQVSLHQWIT